MAPSHDYASGSMPCEVPQLHSSTVLEGRPATRKRAIVVGLYGVPGSGKTSLLDQLKQELDHEQFGFYDGSKAIANVIPGGLNEFHKLAESEKAHWRQLAITTIRSECDDSGRVAIVAGHFMFWPEEEEVGHSVCTQEDLDTFTHILYLDVPAETVLQHRLHDANRDRPTTSIIHLAKWQQAEKTQLRDICRNYGILFSTVFPHPTLLKNVSTLLRDFQLHTEKYNSSLVESVLDGIVITSQCRLETVLVLDADRTLAAADTGTLFWERVSGLNRGEEECPLNTLFSSSLGYSYTAFRQAVLLYEEITDDEEFEDICREVASMVTMYAEFVSLLHSVSKEDHVGAVIVTCGLRRVWEKVLEREGLSKTVKVIGGGRIADGFVITAAVKANLVARLRDTHQMFVWAFGDSPLDLEMMKMADQAIVVVGEVQTRSKTMDAALRSAIRDHGLRARQVLLPSHATTRLQVTDLPLVQLTAQEFVDSVLCRRSRQAGVQVLHATNRNAAKLLMTPMRDANISGPALREAHRRVGQYLAIEFLPYVVGVENYRIPHVQGGHTSGYRLLNEEKTCIVALMRGGEPMAFGVNDIFPLAMFIHASRPEDIKVDHLRGKLALVLVDSVVNNGKTVVQFEQHVRKLHANIHIIVIAGVVQAESISEGGLIHGLSRHTRLDLIALRLSDNKFTGRGTTDTGNRLFNTTHLL